MLCDVSGRKISYLRLSLTAACPLRCFYCRPASTPVSSGKEILTPSEIETLIRFLVHQHGLRKVRLTGGDPTSREDLVEIIARLAGIPELTDLAMTTHGLTLARNAGEYKKAGLKRVNISLDSLDTAQFERITGSNGLERVLAGIHAAQEAGLHPVRLNTVVIRGENEDQLISLLQFSARHKLEIRFIELMPMGPLAGSWHSRYLPEAQMHERMAPFVQSWHHLPRAADSAKRYRVILDDGTMTTIGFISAMSGCFCDDCNRIRITSEGSVFPCLMGEPRGNVFSALRPHFDALRLDEILTAALKNKLPQHPASGTAIMTQIGG